MVTNGRSASQIRPCKMKLSFENIGYQVTCVVGYGKERKEAIAVIKKRIMKGEQFDFIYSESLTQPTLLSEKNHLPVYPFVDFSFFSYCKSKGIKTGLFYRDIYWRFDELYEAKSFFHSFIAKIFYYYDLVKYRGLDTIFLPSNEMASHIPILDHSRCVELPPGTSKSDLNQSFSLADDQPINILYVGGLSDGYPMDVMFEALSQCPYINFTLCTRIEDWQSYKKKNSIPSNVQVVHESGKSLEKLFKNAHICSLFFEPQVWREFAFPYKFFEYLSYDLPVICVNDTPPSRIVNEHGLGWSINYSLSELIALFNSLQKDNSSIVTASRKINEIKEQFSWESRAKFVENRLMKSC